MINSQEDWPGAVTNQLFNGVTRGARPTNPAMHACGLMDGALGATDTLHDKPFDIELSSAGPPLPEDDPAGKKSRKA